MVDYIIEQIGREERKRRVQHVQLGLGTVTFTVSKATFGISRVLNLRIADGPSNCIKSSMPKVAG